MNAFFTDAVNADRDEMQDELDQMMAEVEEEEAKKALDDINLPAGPIAGPVQPVPAAPV